ncbi:hypothetical protein [Algoriphagus sp. PAP.12]|uniref:hypothetical protein n=1 Tax=Algoriphagus sp. PAP.12 TaxID=2996678 RepID=UPI00227C43F0|nr:hypothetical protein [Algoriphagus sp. PAP.12]
MKKLLFFLFVIPFSTICKAEYEQLNLYELALYADKVVVGTIVYVDPIYFTIKVEESLTNHWGFLKIRRFIDWTCAMRWTPYQVGQKLLFFLEEEEGDYFPIGAGNEGEMPVKEGRVYINDQALNGLGFYPPPNFVYKSNFRISPFLFYEGKYHGIEYGLRELFQIIQQIKKCYFIDFQSEWPYHRKFLCTEDEILAKSEGSDLRLSIFYDFKNRMGISSSKKVRN